MGDKKRKNVFTMVKAVRDSTLKNFRGTERHLALILALYADRDGGNIFPGIETLQANLGGVGRDVVFRTLSKLKKRGILEVELPGAGRRHATHYRMIEAALSTSSVSVVHETGIVASALPDSETIALALGKGSVSVVEKVAPALPVPFKVPSKVPATKKVPDRKEYLPSVGVVDGTNVDDGVTDDSPFAAAVFSDEERPAPTHTFADTPFDGDGEED